MVAIRFSQAPQERSLIQSMCGQQFARADGCSVFRMIQVFWELGNGTCVILGGGFSRKSYHTGSCDSAKVCAGGVLAAVLTSPPTALLYRLQPTGSVVSLVGTGVQLWLVEL